jgi:hypothetical protein
METMGIWQAMAMADAARFADSPSVPPQRVAWRRCGLILLAAGMLFFVPLPNDYRARWYSAAQDLAHVPLFAMLTFLTGRLCWPERIARIAIAAAGLAAAIEIVQPLVGRSASWHDLIYGIVGVAVAVVGLQTRWPVAMRLAIGAALVAWPLAQNAPVMIDAFQSWRSFPVLVGPARAFENRGWLLQGTTMTRHADALRLSFAAAPQGAGAVLLPVVRDWDHYESLDVDFEFTGEPLVLLISVRDGKRLPPELPRFDLWQRYMPGRHRVHISLDELRRGGPFPPIDLRHVQSFHLVAYGDEPRTVDIRRIALSGSRAGQ